MKHVSPHQLLLFLFCFVNCIVIQTKTLGQIVHRQTISAQGGTYTNSNGLIFSQSIGQLSINGTFIQNKLVVQQGFQQSLMAIVSNTIAIPDFSVTIYPNPVVDSFTILLANATEETLTIKITNLLGQQLYQGQLPSFQSQKSIPFGSYPGGTYLVQLFTAHQIVTKKIIKI
jgi:hypothetical protein